MHDIIIRELKMDFINNVETLERIYSHITLPLINQNRKETIFSNGMGMNFPYSYIGKYYEGKKNTIWVGYYEPYGLCVSFLKKEQAQSITANIENSGYEYIGTKGYGNEGYWYTILLSEAFKQNQNLQGTDIYNIANEIILKFDI